MHRQPPALQGVRAQAPAPQSSATPPPQPLAVEAHEVIASSLGVARPQDPTLVYQRLAAAADAQNGADGNGTSSVSDILCLRDAPPAASRGTSPAMTELLQQLPPALPLPPESLCAMRRSLREVLKALCRSLASELRGTKGNEAIHIELEAAVPFCQASNEAWPLLIPSAAPLTHKPHPFDLCVSAAHRLSQLEA